MRKSVLFLALSCFTFIGSLSAAINNSGNNIIIQDFANPDISNLLRDALCEYNSPYIQTRNKERFAIFAKNDQGYVIGGLSGYVTQWHAFIEYTWVHPNFRGCGLGRQLIQMLEKLAQEKGYTHIDLCTFAFQAPMFYEKLGFTRVGEVKKWVGEYDVYFYRKEVVLNPPYQE